MALRGPGALDRGVLAASPAPARTMWWALGTAVTVVALAFLLANMPWLGVGLVIATIVAILLVVRPLAVVAGVLFIGPVDLSFLTGGYKGLFENVGGLDMNGLRLLAIVGGLGLLALSNARVRAVAFGRHARWYLVFLVFATATLAYSPAPLDGLRLLMKLTYPFLMFVTVLALVDRREQLDSLANWALAGAFLLTVLLNPFFALSGGFFYDDVLGGIRVTGLGIHPAPWSFYLLLMLTVAVTRFVTRREFRYIGLAAVCVFWITLALARTAMLAGLASLAVMMLHWALVQRNYRMIIAGAIVGGALGFLLWPTFAGKTFGQNAPGFFEFLALLRTPATLIPMLSLSGRELVWPVIFFFFLTSPIVGLGLGGTTPLMESQFSADAGGVVHNEFLRIAAETGVVGFTLFTIALLMWWRGVLRAAVVRTPLATEWTVPALAALVVWAVTGFSDNAIDYYTSVSQYVALFAAGAILTREKLAEPDDAATVEEVAA